MGAVDAQPTDAPSKRCLLPDTFSIHLRTTNPIESTFATVRLRHCRTKGNGSRTACLTMVFKLMQSASKRWRLLNGSQLLPDVIAGAQFVDGIKPQEAAAWKFPIHNLLQ